MPTTQDDFREDLDDGNILYSHEMGRPVKATEQEQPLFRLLVEKRHDVGTESDGSPEQIPELTRELVMLDGALQGVELRAAELVARLDPIITNPDEVVKMLQDGPTRKRESMAPQSFAARKAANFQSRLSAIESLLEAVTHRLGV